MTKGMLPSTRRRTGTFARLPVGLVTALASSLFALSEGLIPPRPPDATASATAVAQSDQYEVAAAWDALAQSRDGRIRAFAQQMVDEHMQADDTLRQAVARAGLAEPPKAMSSDQAQMLAALQSVRGVDFDRAYVKQQILAHDQALAVAGTYASDGDTPALRDIAHTLLPMIEHHRQMAEQLESDLGAP